jgi:hypothetical protein
MRTNWKVSALSLVLVLGACSRREESAAALPDDLKKDLAVASASGGDLAIAPQGYQRARFVSAIEQSRAAQPARRPKSAHHALHAMVTHVSASATTTDAAPEPAMDVASEAPEPVATPAETAPEPTAEVAPHPSPEPVRQAGASEEIGAGDRGRGSGLGGLLGGIIGAVVIRGGHGGIDKCDPRHEGRGGTTIVVGRPDFGGYPVPIGQPTFPGSRRVIR